LKAFSIECGRSSQDPAQQYHRRRAAGNLATLINNNVTLNAAGIAATATGAGVGLI
jgi:hypothetical protein